MKEEIVAKWTRFMDMHSGGGTKEDPYEFIYIEASEEEAKRIFYNKFDHNPYRVSCTCCGGDYSISETASFAEASAYDRNCKWCASPKGSGLKGGYFEKGEEPSGWKNDSLLCWSDYQTVEEYQAQPNVLVIKASEIKDSERGGEVPDEGYVWV